MSDTNDPGQHAGHLLPRWPPADPHAGAWRCRPQPSDPGRHTGGLYQAKALFAERSAYETAKTANHSSAVSIPE
jgi:hypothetical protein